MMRVPTCLIPPRYLHSPGGLSVSNLSSRARRILAATATTGVTVGVVAVGGAPPAAADPSVETGPLKVTSADVLGAHDRELLAEAEAKGQKRVTIMVAADRGRTQAVSAELAKIGGAVANRVDAVGYVRASMPTSAVLRAAAVPGVTAVDLDEKIGQPVPDVTTGPGTAATDATLLAGPGPDTPAANPYMPTNETGAVAFKDQHPTWDGRGITIGILDTGVDLDNPALRTTTTGERKIVDWVTATDPVFDGDATWRAMLTAVTGPSFTYAGGTWTAPDGTWRINRFTEAITAASVPGGDVNRDGDTTDVFGILYDPVSHDIRVDVNQNRDFTDDAVMRPYRERYDIGHFGTDNPTTAVREQMPFTVEYREDVDTTPAGGPGLADYVNIGIIENQHGSHVAGITAANDMLGNPVFDGAAPGAKLVSARACNWGGGCTTAATTDGMVDLVVNRHVDVVNMSIGGLPALNDGNNARTELYNRLIRDYGVQIFLSAGNSGPGVNTIGDPAVSSDAVASASSISQETWLANYGSVTRTPMQLHNYSSRGPREDGGLKPNRAAPGALQLGYVDHGRAGVRAGQRPGQRARRLGAAVRRGAGSHVQDRRPGLHPAVRLPRHPQPRHRHLQPLRRGRRRPAAPAGEVVPGDHHPDHRGGRRHRAPAALGRQRRHVQQRGQRRAAPQHAGPGGRAGQADARRAQRRPAHRRPSDLGRRRRDDGGGRRVRRPGGPGLRLRQGRRGRSQSLPVLLRHRAGRGE